MRFKQAFLLCLVLAGLMPVVAGAQPAERPVIAVAEFKNESNAGWWGNGLGWDLAGLLSNELAATGSFRVVERDRLRSVLEEQNLMASGRAATSDAAAMGRLAGAQYLVMGTVTSFEEGTERNNGGFSFGGVSLGGNSRTAYVAIDIRVVDTTTGTIEYVRTIEGSSRSGGSNVGLSFGGASSSFGAERNSPAGRAVRSAVVMVSEYLDCVMVRQDSCRREFDEAERRRRERTSGELDID
jgi:curli biogenesis system outer membrane secretion channel CsgG